MSDLGSGSFLPQCHQQSAPIIISTFATEKKAERYFYSSIHLVCDIECLHAESPSVGMFYRNAILNITLNLFFLSVSEVFKPHLSRISN